MEKIDIKTDLSTVIKPLYISLSKIDLASQNNNFYSLNKSEKNCENKSVLKTSNSSQRFTCSFSGCSKSFGKRSRLILHERIHTGERPFKCNYENCRRSYTRNFHLTRHIAVSHLAVAEIDDEFGCDLCLKTFSNPYSLKKHKTQFHSRRQYICNECGQEFRKQHCLKSHSYVHSGVKPYKCEHAGCDSSFVILNNLKRHMLLHIKDRYRCQYADCSRTFDVFSDLRKHVTNDHVKVCDECGAEFKKLVQLKGHLKSHENLREAFFCPYDLCERYYLEEKNLHQHIRSKHDENFRGFQCTLCEKFLVTKQKLKLHMLTHDPNRPKPSSPKKKQRKPRKDKGTSKTDFAKKLSGYKPQEVPSREENIKSSIEKMTIDGD